MNDFLDDFVGFMPVGDTLVRISTIHRIDFSDLENGRVVVCDLSGNQYVAKDFDALRLAVTFMGNSLEGKQLKWVKNAWWFHNIVAHPLMQILTWFGFRELGLRIHDRTTPKPIAFREVKR